MEFGKPWVADLVITDMRERDFPQPHRSLMKVYCVWLQTVEYASIVLVYDFYAA